MSSTEKKPDFFTNIRIFEVFDKLINYWKGTKNLFIKIVLFLVTWPAMAAWWIGKKYTGASRQKYTLISFVGIVMFSLFLNSIANSPNSTQKIVSTNSRSSSSQSSQPVVAIETKSESISLSSSTSKADQTTKVNFTGKITPTVAISGDKIVIAVTVENLSGKTLDGFILRFSDCKFIKALTIVNVIGGVEDNSCESFLGNYKIMSSLEVSVGHPITVNIIAYSADMGNFDSTITLLNKNLNDSNLKDAEGEELKTLIAKIVLY